ncbi:hypothetical protein E2C01_024550 [Portunus trituberculatus]|uniref:Uncharacterized protein n=1 Tax=Portunus trituberculatus TaxID=210409 RepID=A0A5B7ED07_PORTR|nr:hypothetical protein [Portunus trituberculatus]
MNSGDKQTGREHLIIIFEVQTLNKDEQLSNNDQLPGRASSSSSSYQEQANSTLNYSTSQVVVSHNLENCLVVYSVAQAVLRGGRSLSSTIIRAFSALASLPESPSSRESNLNQIWVSGMAAGDEIFAELQAEYSFHVKCSCLVLWSSG